MMNDNDWVGRVVDSMHSLQNEFGDNELAYLALTSKVEQPIVDRLAYSLHREYGEDKRVGIAREFSISHKIQRVDLAVTSDNQPVLFLEAKAMGYYHMYMPSAGSKYPDKVSGDIHKMRGYITESTGPQLERIALLLTTYSRHVPRENMDGVIKYAGTMRTHSGKHYSDVKSEIDKHFSDSRFRLLNSGAGDISGGQAFGMDVIVHFRLFGPY